MVPAKSSSGKDVYSVILPTFNERQNLPIITWLLNRTFTEQYVFALRAHAYSLDEKDFGN